MIKNDIAMEARREQLWAKIADVWLCEIYLVTKDVIEPSPNLIKLMANTIMGELLAKGLTSHDEMLAKFTSEVGDE